MDNKILDILKNRRNNLFNELENRKKEILIPIDNFTARLIEIAANPLVIASLSIEELKKNIPSIDSEVIKRLEMYKKLSTLSFFPLTEEQKIDISSIMQKNIDNLNEKRKIIIQSDNMLSTYNDKINEINEIIIKIEGLYKDNKYLSSKDLEDIIIILKELALTLDEQISIIQELALTSLKTINNMKNEEHEEEVIKLEETSIDADDLINIFKKYNYDFDSFDDKSKNLLLRYGKIDNIDKILKVFRESNVPLNIKDFSSKICKILIGSDSDIVSTIINNIKVDFEKSKNKSFEEIFNNHLNMVDIFIRGKREYKKIVFNKETKKEESSKYTSEYMYGVYDNYIKNRELLIENGVEIDSAVERSPSFFAEPYQKVKQNLESFKFYGIPKEVYANTLSAFSAIDPLSSIDQFIEVGCYEYILSNFSRVNVAPNSLLFYRIIKAGQDGDRIYSERKTKSIQLDGTISDDRKKGYGIDSQNKAEIVSQYFPTFDPKYEETIQNGRNMGPIIMAYNNYFIQALEQYKIDDLRYDFNGVIISRYKVLRIYETLMKNHEAGTYSSILYAICKNSILTEEQYKNIIDCLDRAYGKNLRGVARV